MHRLVRSAALTHFASVARSFALDPHALVSQAGLPARCLDEPDLKVPARAVGQLLEMAAERSREPGFALLMVQARRLSNLGPLALLVRDEPTLRLALEALVRHIHLHNEALVLRVEQVGPMVIIREELAADGGVLHRQASELVVGVTFRVLSLFMGAGWRPRLVCFSHRAPANTAVHRRLFGDAVQFGHEFNGLVCHASNLDLPNPGADPVMAHYAHGLLGEHLRGELSLSERVRQFVVLLLPRGHCRIEGLAQHLGVDRRTVARRLASEGTSFSELVDDVRADLLARYLDDGTRPLGDLAPLLGFSAPSALSRWHRQRFGATARDRRRAVTSPAARPPPVTGAGLPRPTARG